MRKLKLQMQISLDGFVARPDGALDWMWASGSTDGTSMQKVLDIADASDVILMGRKMTKEFVTYWENVVDNQPDSPELPLARRMVDLNKISFSHTVKKIEGRNLRMENGDLVTTIKALKEQPGKDILVYGGAGFASSLIKENLVDEFLFYVSPIAIGEGLSIFQKDKLLKLVDSVIYQNGKILNTYVPA